MPDIVSACLIVCTPCWTADLDPEGSRTLDRVWAAKWQAPVGLSIQFAGRVRPEGVFLQVAYFPRGRGQSSPP